MSDDIREWAADLTRNADAAKAEGKDVLMQISHKTAHVLADCVVRYFGEERRVCPVCDQIRDQSIEDLVNNIGSLRYLIADLATAIDMKPALVEKIRVHVTPGRKPGPIISHELRANIAGRKPR
jgi:hypothetical protein